MARLFIALLAALLLLGLPGAQPVQAQVCGPTYQVQAGETLYSIAEKCRVSYLVLVGINVEMRDPNTIYPGQIIRLVAEAPLEFFEQPASGPAEDAGLQPDLLPDGAYVVRPGDSLALIAYRYNTSVVELMEYNPQVRERAVIYPGQVLRMPPSAKRVKGWIGLSTLSARGGNLIQVRLADFTPYALVDFRLGIKDDEDTFTTIVQARTDAKGDARVTMRLPFTARSGQVWEVRVFHLEDADVPPVVSAPINIP